MFLKDITKSRLNREYSQIYDLRKSLIFHIQGNVRTNDGYFEYRLQTVGKKVFNICCLVCGKYLNIEHKNIEVIPHETKAKRWKISDRVREEDLRDKLNHGEIFHHHSNCILILFIKF